MDQELPPESSENSVGSPETEGTESLVKPVKFLVCVDETEHARIALHFACSQAIKRHGNVDILYVVEPTDFNTFGGLAEKMREEQRAEGETFLAKQAEFVRETFKLEPTLLLREGKLEEEIIGAVEEDYDADMLVMGAAPDTSSKRGNLIANLASKMGEKLLIPLLLVPSSLTEQQIEELS